ncbi:MAG: DUF2804 domain-containing protein [Spirochaetaceae bacterium]|jgi:hypothetical protein|nr:DUF2804 domain-containing protein [Spirochaetaceae bacterium]
MRGIAVSGSFSDYRTDLPGFHLKKGDTMLENTATNSYSRQIKSPRTFPIQNGKPVQGTWTTSFPKVDLLEIQHPYRLPLPPSLRNYRIKEWQSFIVQNDEIYLEAFFANIKYYSFAEVFFFDKQTKENLRYFKVLPFHPWKMPIKLANSSVESKNFGFYFNIHSWLDAELIKLDINIAPSLKRPAFTANIEFDLSGKCWTPLAASLLFSETRSMYTYKSFSPVRGKLQLGGKVFQALHRRKTTGLFRDCKGFYPYRMRALWCSGCGFDAQGRRFGFSLGENQAQDAQHDNENGFWLDGSLTLLPPVKMTQTGDAMSDWVVQDLEGMVDLTFTPAVLVDASFNLILTKSSYFTPVGKFNGMLKTGSGEEIKMNNVWGSLEQLYLRV